MIRPLDTLTLARTKLRSKRILLGITVIVSGLLFGILSAAILVATGMSQSTEQFFTKALNGRYLVEASPNIPNAALGYDISIFAPSKELIKKLTTLQDTYIAKQKAVYDQHKQPFDESTIEPILKASPIGEKDSAGNPVQAINRLSPVYQEYLDQLMVDYTKVAKNKVSDLKKMAAPYGALDYYHNEFISLPSLKYLKGGQEILEEQMGNPRPSNDDYMTSNIQNSSYLMTDQSLIQRFIYPDNDRRKQNTDAIPVVLTTQEIEKVFGKELGINKRPSSTADQVAWVQDLQKKANGHTYVSCYRSQGEIALIQKTMKDNTEMVDKKNDKTYSPPRLLYNLPTTPCGELTIKKDARSNLEKQLVAKEETLQKELGTYQPIEHELLKFQIVGAFTGTSFGSQPRSATALISYVLGPQYMQSAFIPQQLYDALPPASQHKNLLQTDANIYQNVDVLEEAGITTTIMAFPTISAARDFIKHSGGCSDMSTECKKPFFFSTYGSSYLAIDEISAVITKFAPIALVAALFIATIIIWITMARVIIDSRRETAVFRALGAKRHDIASIYLLYSLLVALLIVIFMLVLGFIIATTVEALYSTEATNLAKVAYGVFDKLEPFHFMAINLPLLAGLSGCVFVISLLAVVFPLWRNVRRSPIRDMRDE